LGSNAVATATGDFTGILRFQPLPPGQAHLSHEIFCIAEQNGYQFPGTFGANMIWQFLLTLGRSARLVFIALLAFTLYMAFRPSAPSNDLLGWDKADHFVAYFGLAAMATLVIGFKPRLKWAILGVIFLSGALEILQAFTGRDAEMLDFVANSLGALTGWGAGAGFLLLLQRRGVLVAAPASD